MRCIFCKQPSDASKSVEHVIPESLGNHTLLLPAGVVCDDCNNYFGRKVEKPFLDSPVIRVLRYEEALPGKRGRPLRVPVSAVGGGGAELVTTSRDIPPQLMFDRPGELLRFLTQPRQLLLSEERAIPPTDVQVSRLLAKITIGYIAASLLPVAGGLTYLLDEKNLDPLRNHARRGAPANWPTSARRIYPANACWHEKDQEVQRVWEATLFEDDLGSQYFVLALFGWEFVIHIGEPDISGYRRWLLRNGGMSPLFTGVHAGDLGNRVAKCQHQQRRRRALFGYRWGS